MRAIVQRVNHAKLSVDDKLVSSIGHGLLVYLGVCQDDNESDVYYLAKKISGLRIFKDSEDKMNLSVKDVGGEILLVSNFTIYGDCSRGNRPNFMYAMEPQKANELYKMLKLELEKHDIHVETGMFGEHMHILVENDGPINIILSSPNTINV